MSAILRFARRVAVLISVLLLLAGAYLLQKRGALLVKGQTSRGRVAGIAQATSTAHWTSVVTIFYYPRVQFTDGAGEEHEFVSTIGTTNADAYHVGQTVYVLYQQAVIGDAMIDDAMIDDPYEILELPVGLLLFSLGLFTSSRWATRTIGVVEALVDARLREAMRAKDTRRAN